MIRLSLTTSAREELRDVTAEVRAAVRERGWRDGALLLHCPHTTGAVTINTYPHFTPQKSIFTDLPSS